MEVLVYQETLERAVGGVSLGMSGCALGLRECRGGRGGQLARWRVA